MKGVVGWAVIGMLSLFVGSFLVSRTRQASTCVICRADREGWEYLGLRGGRESATDLSRWYAAHVEPAHAHLWEPSPCYYETNIWGSSLGSGCYVGRYPIWKLAPATQKAVYLHFRDPLEARTLFVGLATDGSHDAQEGRRVVRSLGEWEAAGFPGHWEEWQARRTEAGPRRRRIGPGE